MIELETAGSSSSRGLLSVPPKIERHASEPAPSMTPSSPHLLPIPQSTPFLMKQHSHPLLPSQSPPAPLTSSGGPHGIGLNLHRQLSHPISQATTLSVTESIQLSSSSTTVLSTGTLTNTPGLVQFVTAPIKTEAEKLTGVHSPSVLIVTEPITTTSCAIENIPTLRVKSEELQRSVSSPQATRELTLENPRSSHCPVIRPGPALGCNFCWNTIDAHGRILRRKTKYHCPECQTNLCIVPCFQEYHERQASENPSNNDNTSSVASSSSKTLAGLRHYPKTGSL